MSYDTSHQVLSFYKYLRPLDKKTIESSPPMFPMIPLPRHALTLRQRQLCSISNIFPRDLLVGILHPCGR